MSQPASPSQAPASLPTSNGKFTHPASSSRASSQSSSETRSLYTPLYDQLDQLTTVIQHVGDDIQTCKTASEERHQVRQAREEEQKKRTASVQEQLAQMLAMTQESLRRKREEAASVAVRSGASDAGTGTRSGSRTFAQELQSAAFGPGGSAETASRSSMLESRESELESVSTSDSRNSQR